MTKIKISVAQYACLSAFVGKEYVVLEDDNKCFAVYDDPKQLAAIVRISASQLEQRDPEPSSATQAKRNAKVRSLKALAKKLDSQVMS